MSQEKSKRVTRNVVLVLVVAVALGVAIGVVGTGSRKNKTTEDSAFELRDLQQTIPPGTLMQCPSETGTSISFTTDASEGERFVIDLEVSASDSLCTLVEVSPDGQFISPMARSYNGLDWETSAGKYAADLTFECNGDTCSVSLPPLPTGAIYQLTSFERPSYNGLERAARFLEQATFGPKRDEILELSQGSDLAFADWIKEQQEEIPITSHRAIYRKYLNARFEVNSPLGPVTQPCQAGTRYRWTAFSVKDDDKSLSIETQSTPSGDKRVLSVNGFVRTVMDARIGIFRGRVRQVDWEDGFYRICAVGNREENGVLLLENEAFGGCVPVIFTTSSANGGSTQSFYSNPPIVFDPSLGIEPGILLDIPSGYATDIDSVYYEDFDPQRREIIITEDLVDAKCSELDPRNDEPAFAAFDNELWVHDPRFRIFDNTEESPLPDGGGELAEMFGSFDDFFSTRCANVPRTFLNEENCVLSFEPTSCSYNRDADEDREDNRALFSLDEEAIRTVYEVTGAGDPGTVYLYAIDNLDVKQDPNADSPCQKLSETRWIRTACSSEPQDLGFRTTQLMSRLVGFFSEENSNPNVVDVFHPADLRFECNEADLDKVGFEVPVDIMSDDECWRNVHPDHLNVYDFTIWTVDHPGNINGRNPIKEFAEAGETKLFFPESHELTRWNTNKNRFLGPIRLGDEISFYNIPADLRTVELAEALGVTIESSSGGFQGTSSGTIVCGSPFEVSNEPFEGGSVGQGAFDANTDRFVTTPDLTFFQQRQVAWTTAALDDPGQLRQRAAWALSQILVISPDSSNFALFTEAFLVYYDIFVRNAFGNYKNILKEVSYSRLMAEMLTYYGGRSTANVWERDGNLEFADENYAREIMQLFTIGLFRLNADGTETVDNDGSRVKTYTNDDIEEYARVWTGFLAQQRRGNVEMVRENAIDPMYIETEFRDRFPKMGLDRKYIGDGYPLCIDLPNQHFLEEGALFRLVGGSAQAELHNDPTQWADDPMTSLTLDTTSELYKTLCSSPGGSSCSFPVSVTLPSTLRCTGSECSVDTVRLVEVAGQHYEYIRPACIQHGFFNNGKIISRRFEDENVMCGDPRLEIATAACCEGGRDAWEWGAIFHGERMSFDTAEQRCGGTSCATDASPSCDEEIVGLQCEDNDYYWTEGSCNLGAIISDTGRVAIAHLPEGLAEGLVDSSVRAGVPKTFFRVDWNGSFESILSGCGINPLCQQVDGNCGCATSVEENQVFLDRPSRDEVLSQLTIGAFEPDGTPDEESGGVSIYYAPGGTLSKDSVFGVLDDNGVQKYFKNLNSSVIVGGSSISFRNPVHFINLADPELRDAQYETDAALDHYFYHPNTAPFLAIRFAQRFGVSNPSPRYVETIATAFRDGFFEFEEDGEIRRFGSEEYGDLAATFAAVLLDREARSEELDADPSFGSLKEPLIKVLGLMRSLEFRLDDDEPWVEFGIQLQSQMGQTPHRIPTVFSYFLPEYEPAGPVAQGSLVAPEAQLLTGPRIIDSMNGIFSLIRYGFSSCFGGFGGESRRNDVFCEALASPEYDGPRGTGELTYLTDSTSASQIVDELAILMTSGRLSQQNRQRITQAINLESGTDAAKVAQLLIASTPEFHATNLVRKNGSDRPLDPPPQPSSKPYKAVVYLLLAGGADSYNILAPHACTQTNAAGKTLLEQYYDERSSIAITQDERSLIIDAEGQPCDKFVLNQDVPVINDLYKDGDLAFFANIGALDLPVTKENYLRLTETELFAHNTMQREAQRIDPLDEAPGTGILGRMTDVLASKGFTPQPITIQDATIATVGTPGQTISPLIVSQSGLNQFDLKPEEESFDVGDYVRSLNDATTLQSSVFAETWSDKLQKPITDSERLVSAIDNVELTQTYNEDNSAQSKMSTVSKLILTQQERGTDRDVIFLEIGGWDHHEQLKPGLSRSLQELNGALDVFQKEMKAQGLWDQVTLVVTSEFARTLTPNSGDGSDHAWGGNSMVMGGSVKGGQIYGDYPDDITASGPLNVGRGRLIPTSSWETLFNSVVEWMGVDSAGELDFCMPNRLNTGARLYTSNEVFEGSNPSLRRNQ